MKPPVRDLATDPELASAAEEAGIDVTICEFRGEKVGEDERPWVRGRDGAGAHAECVESFEGGG